MLRLEGVTALRAWVTEQLFLVLGWDQPNTIILGPTKHHLICTLHILENSTIDDFEKKVYSLKTVFQLLLFYLEYV